MGRSRARMRRFVPISRVSPRQSSSQLRIGLQINSSYFVGNPSVWATSSRNREATCGSLKSNSAASRASGSPMIELRSTSVSNNREAISRDSAPSSIRGYLSSFSTAGTPVSDASSSKNGILVPRDCGYALARRLSLVKTFCTGPPCRIPLARSSQTSRQDGAE